METTLSDLLSMYNIIPPTTNSVDEGSTEEQTTKKETRGRKPKGFYASFPYISQDDGVICPYPWDDLIAGALRAFSEENTNTRPFVNISKLIQLINNLDGYITVKRIQDYTGCSPKQANRYYCVMEWLNNIYNQQRSKAHERPAREKT